MKNWLKYFEHNRDHRREIPWDLGVNVDARMCAPLIHSLQRFQVGESGEGRHLRKQAATTNDDVYTASIDLFIKEEQEHARLMAEILRRMNAKLLNHHWSDACFILLRRLFGLNQELLVLLMPEMIAKRFFRALHDGSKDPVLQAVFAQIMHDEEGHLAFHV
ncbi:MAG TPA: ferritin-like domain-containing protein, partial [Verrucomicrobiae bacterium]|nr:ferritin-like domain-containing protein [Verrucomicrobiae bacterium]